MDSGRAQRLGLPCQLVMIDELLSSRLEQANSTLLVCVCLALLFFCIPNNHVSDLAEEDNNSIRGENLMGMLLLHHAHLLI